MPEPKKQKPKKIDFSDCIFCKHCDSPYQPHWKKCANSYCPGKSKKEREDYRLHIK